MKILIINPPHQSIGSRLAKEHLPPLGLLNIAGPLIDHHHEVQLLDADYSNMPLEKILQEIMLRKPALIMLGHSGSSTAQPVINDICSLVKNHFPKVLTVVGGVYPSFHDKELLYNTCGIDFVVRGEGEQVALDLVEALENTRNLSTVNGISYLDNGAHIRNKDADLIHNLDDYRTAWELMGNRNYTYWGKRKAVVLQFSRGCPHACSYCGQTIFWKRWRQRSPESLVDEIEMLKVKFGIEVINFADESPATNQSEWIRFLKLLIERKLNMILVGSIRADHIVRDEVYLPLYKAAGFDRFLMGIETYDEAIMLKINKGGSVAKDREAIQLLRCNNILSMATYVVGFGDERFSDYWKSIQHLLSYDPDQIQLLYATPHDWTPYFKELKLKNVVLADSAKWDYKHQVIEMKHFKPWQLLLIVKAMEVIMQARPLAIWRRLFHPDKRLRKAMAWYNSIGKRVYFYEIWEFFVKLKYVSQPLVLQKNIDLEKGKLQNQKYIVNPKELAS